MTTHRVLAGDCREKPRELRDSTISLVLTDPPYFLHRMDADWDHPTWPHGPTPQRDGSRDSRPA